MEKSAPPETSLPPEPECYPDLIPPEWPRRPMHIRLLFALAGAILVIVGIIGWLLPIVPGLFLVPIGLILMAAVSTWVSGHVNRWESRLPVRWRRLIRKLLHRSSSNAFRKHVP